MIASGGFLRASWDDLQFSALTGCQEKGRTLCLPYSMETNDFSLVLTKQFDARQYAQTIEDHITQLAKEDGEKVVYLGTLQS